MLKHAELRETARARLKDSQALLSAKRYDGAVYLCGYAVEIALKARVCIVLKWRGFPSSYKEFENYRSFRTHNLDVLLSLSGREDKIKTNYLVEWSAVVGWDPEVRYFPVGSATEQNARLFVESARVVLRAL